MSTATVPPKANVQTCRESALYMLGLGFHPVVIYPKGADRGKRGPSPEGKDPMGEGWGLHQITTQQINMRFRRFPDAKTGICFGPGKGPKGEWLVDFEGDGPESEDSFLALMGGEIVKTMSWTSRRNPHRVFCVDERFEALLTRCGAIECEGEGGSGAVHLAFLPDLEIRKGGWKSEGVPKQIQSVIPPSVGLDGVARQWIHGPECLTDLPEAAYAYLEAYAKGLEAHTRDGVAGGGANNGTGNGKWSERLAENNLSVCGYFSAEFSSQHLSLSGQYFGAGLCGHIV